MSIRLKRIYEPPASSDGLRILVERLWPRGMSRDAARIDHWAKEVSPSPALRRWYGHDPEKWPEFQRRYRAELEANVEAVEALSTLCAKRAITFVFAAKDETRNSAAALKSFLEAKSQAITPI